MSKKVTLNKQDLYEVLNATSKFFAKKNTIPIMDSYKFTVTPTNFTVTVSNPSASIERSLPIMGFESFEVCVDKSILAFIQKCPNGDMTLEFMDYGKVLIQAGKVKFETVTLDADQYPALPKTEETESISLGAKVLEEMLGGVEFAAAGDESAQKILTAINFSIQDGVLTLSALDGYRVAVQSKKVDCEVNVNINIPPICRFIKSMDSKDDVKVSWDGAHIVLESTECKVICRLIEGKYMDVSRFLKSDSSSEVVMDREAMLESLERAALIGKGKDSPVILDLAESIMVIQMQEAKGKFEEMLEMKKEGKNLRIGFDVAKLIDALNKIADKTVKLLFSGAKSPLLIKSEDVAKRDDYSYLVLPVNIANK